MASAFSLRILRNKLRRDRTAAPRRRQTANADSRSRTETARRTSRWSISRMIASRLVGGIDRLHRETDMVANDLRRRTRHPGNFRTHAFPGLVGTPDKSAKPGQAGLDRDNFQIGKLREYALGNHALQLIFERRRLRDIVLDIIRRPADWCRRIAVGAAGVNADRQLQPFCQTGRSARAGAGPAWSRRTPASTPARNVNRRRGARSPRPQAPYCARGSRSTHAAADRG